MNATQFLQIARQQISTDPRTRLTAPTMAALDDPNCLVDVHSHIFDKKSLNIPYILLRLSKSKLGLEAVSAGLLGKTEEEIYKDIKSKKLNKNTDWEDLEAELEMMESVELFGMELSDALKVLRKASMQEILDLYLETFAINQLPEFSNHPFATGILLMDLETGWEMKSKKKYYEQVEEVREISKIRPIIPFFAVDPRRADETDPNKNLYDLFIKAFVNETPYFGVKCYPSLGYLPSDTRLDPIFQICAEKNIPVLTHCGGETVSTFKKKIPVRNSTGEIQFTIPGKNRTERANWLNNPAHWDMVLEKHNNLKLNLAHFGGDTNWELLGNSGSSERVEKIIDMMRNPNWKVYADFSFNVVEEELYNAFQNQLDNNADVKSRTLYGTDYWVVLPKGDLLAKQSRFLTQMVNHQASLLQSVPRAYLGI